MTGNGYRKKAEGPVWRGERDGRSPEEERRYMGLRAFTPAQLKLGPWAGAGVRGVYWASRLGGGDGGVSGFEGLPEG